MLIAAAFFFASASAHARVKFPKEKDFQQFRIVCAGGDVQAIQYRVDQVLKEWKSDRSARVDMESARKNLGAVMEKVTPTVAGNHLYESYVSCVRDLIEKYLARMNAPHRPVIPGEDVDGFLTLGVTYGSIRTFENQVRTNDDQVVGLARIGWWFNEHLALGMEGSYWEAEANTVELAGAQVRLTKPLEHVASSVTFPLYLHFGRRVPPVLYAELDPLAWGNVAQWADPRQVEQDLIISRAIVELFSDLLEPPGSPLIVVTRRIRNRFGRRARPFREERGLVTILDLDPAVQSAVPAELRAARSLHLIVFPGALPRKRNACFRRPYVHAGQ